MLVRSASTPILNSCIPSHSLELSPELDFHLQIPKSHQSISLIPPPFNFISRSQEMKFHLNGFVEEEEEMRNSRCLSMDPLFSSSGLDEDCAGGGNGNNGSRVSSGDGFSDSDDPNESTDAYYQKMIESDPGNSLILGNYAKFLKEVRGDVVKAEEYFERAILANPNDGNAASLYADLIWEVHRDSSRAEKYHDQAVQAEPNDCYVMASYARFLWDTEEQEEEEENTGSGSCKNLTRPPDLFQRVSFPTIAAC